MERPVPTPKKGSLCGVCTNNTARHLHSRNAAAIVIGGMESVFLRSMIALFKNIAYSAGQLFPSSHTAIIAYSSDVEVAPAVPPSAEYRALSTAKEQQDPWRLALWRTLQKKNG